jgi:hypothetical protein
LFFWLIKYFFSFIFHLQFCLVAKVILQNDNYKFLFFLNILWFFGFPFSSLVQLNIFYSFRHGFFFHKRIDCLNKTVLVYSFNFSFQVFLNNHI